MQSSFNSPPVGLVSAREILTTTVPAQGKSCPIVPFAEENTEKKTSLLKKIGLFFFRFGVCPMCMTASVSYSVYELMRFRRIRPEHSLWS